MKTKPTTRIGRFEKLGKGIAAGNGWARAAPPTRSTPVPQCVLPSLVGNESVSPPAVPEVAPEPLQPSLPEEETSAPPTLTKALEETEGGGALHPSLLPSPPESILTASPPASPPAPSSSGGPLEETREEAEATSSAPSNGDSSASLGAPGAVAAAETPALAPDAPAPQLPQASQDLAPPVERANSVSTVFKFESLADSVFAVDESPSGVLTYAGAVTPDQCAAFDAAAETEYQNLLVDIREYIRASTALRSEEGSMEWIMSDEEWFLVEAEETAMDFRR